MILTSLIKKILFFAVLLTAIALVSHYPAFVERYYTHGLFIILSGSLRLLFNYIPFSVGDIGYAVLITWAIYGIVICVKSIINRKFRLFGNYLLRGILALQLLISLFYLLWGLNYSRQPAYKVLGLPDTSYTTTDVNSAAALLIDSLNRSRARLKQHDLLAGNTEIYKTSVSAISRLKDNYLHATGWQPQVKNSLFTFFMNYMGTSGYNNPFTGEAQMNTQMPLFDRPVTACHEMAHQLGFAREDEANFAGFLAGSNSTDALQQYSAFYLASQEFLFYLRRRDSVHYQQYRQQLSAQVKADFKADSTYWTKYEGRLERMTGHFYNAFLVANKQPDGLRTYNRMIILTIAYYKQRQMLETGQKTNK